MWSAEGEDVIHVLTQTYANNNNILSWSFQIKPNSNATNTKPYQLVK